MTLSASEMTAWILALFASDRMDVTLFTSAFVSATLAPGGSEMLFAGSVAATPERVLWLLAVASAGNTLGAMTSWAIGRFLPSTKKSSRALDFVRRWGAWALLLSWLPVVGDALPLAAGWLRIGAAPSLVAIAAGKLLRYLALAMMVIPAVT